LESEAILYVLARFSKPDWHWIGSQVLLAEISRNPDPEQRSQVRNLVSLADETVEISSEIISRSQNLKQLGFHSFDAMHIACAEAAEADIFLTTDDRLMRLANRIASAVFVEVRNPLEWVQSAEISDEESKSW
jgi:predicted nucleic acid-binding protein